MKQIIESLELEDCCLYASDFPNINSIYGDSVINLKNNKLIHSKFGSSALHCEKNSYSTINNSEKILNGTPFTLNFWIKLNSSLTYDSDIIIQKGENIKITLSSFKSYFHFNDTEQKSIQIWSDLDPNYCLENYVMLTLVSDSKTLVCYVNAVPNQILQANTIGAQEINESLQIGGFDMDICELFILNKPLLPEQISRVYNYYDVKTINENHKLVKYGCDSISSKKSKVKSNPLFNNPPNIYRQIQYNVPTFHSPNIDEFKQYGIGGVCMAAYHENYLSENYNWDNLRKDIEHCVQNDFHIWFYDEDNYPTGGAGGLLVRDNPEYEVCGIYSVTLDFRGGKKIFLDIPNPEKELFVGAILYKRTTTVIDYDSGILLPFEEKQISVYMEDKNEYTLCGIVKSFVHDNGPTAHIQNYWIKDTGYGNLLDKNACARYIEITHKQYKENLGELFKYVDAFYTGEPQLACVNFANSKRQSNQNYLPFASEFFETFKTLFRYDITPFLLEVFKTPGGDFSRHRQRYFETVGYLMSNNFFDQYSKWCEKNGGKLSGHIILEELISAHVLFYGNFFECISKFQIPGVDHYIYNYAQDYTTSLKTLKFSLSSCHHLGNYLAQGLYEPMVSGSYYIADQGITLTPTLEVMRKNIHQLFAAGCSFITSYISYKNYEKEAFCNFANYLARLCYLLRGAKYLAKVAVYYNIETIQGSLLPSSNYYFDEHLSILSDYEKEHALICEKLFANSVNFNYISAFESNNISVSDGTLNIGDYKYEIVIMPSCKMLPSSITKKISDFEKNGGLVLWIGETPYMGESESEDEGIRAFCENATHCSIEDAIKQANLLDKPLEIIPQNPEKMYYSFFEKDNKQMVFIANDLHKTNTVKIGSNHIKTATIYFPSESEIRVVELPFSVGVEAYSSIVLEY